MKKIRVTVPEDIWRRFGWRGAPAGPTAPPSSRRGTPPAALPCCPAAGPGTAPAARGRGP